MVEAIQVTDAIYNYALQILGSSNIPATAYPLVMGTVTSRIEMFAIGALASEVAAHAEREAAAHAEKEADDGVH